MCGIVGFVNINKQLNINGNTLKLMTDTIKYRGPNSEGHWFDDQRGIGLGHRRLSILDLSDDGHQPMKSKNERYIIVYNGEVYNFNSIKIELEIKGYVFRGHSDTEIILEAINEWGIKEATKKFVGMFAFALWDREEERLYLVRDRLGIKPLYYGFIKGDFVFGSELKAMMKYINFKPDINKDALALYLRHNYIPAPYSIYEGIYKLEPGKILELKYNIENLEYNIEEFWSINNIVSNRKYVDYSENEYVDLLDELINDAIKLRMVADVPVGAFLSGGIDSSTVAAIMQKNSAKKIKTFSIGFYEDEFNEAKYAKEIANYIGTDHTELYLTDKDVKQVIPLLSNMYDEPFSDSSQIPTYLVSKLAAKDVTVSLSGDGGDELFCGYSRYFLTDKSWDRIKNIPHGFRNLTCDTLSGLSNIFDNKYTDRINKLSKVIRSKDSNEFYLHMMSHFKNPTDVVLNSNEPVTNLTNDNLFKEIRNYKEKMMYKDMVSYLPDDILVKVDRASMAVSLEARVPLLDHRIVELAINTPMEYKVKDNKGKWALRQVLNKYVPEKLVDRPKKGFGVPLGKWLREDLKDWAGDLLNEEKIKRERYFDSEVISKMWKEHIEGKRDWKYQLWDILMFESWIDK